MPRKRSRQARTTRTTVSSSRPRKRTFYQCFLCGALVDPMFGLGLGSWCPDCRQPDSIDCLEGQIPDPVRYGAWLQRQKERASSPKPNANEDDRTHLSHPIPAGVTTMKQHKTHTGTYCCPECCIEFDLMAEESLKCDRCGGPLNKGSLEDLWAVEDDLGNGDQ